MGNSFVLLVNRTFFLNKIVIIYGDYIYVVSTE